MAADGNEGVAAGADGVGLPAWVNDALQPLPGDPAGPNLEYDPDMMELVELAKGKPETQFAPAQPPVWGEVRDRAIGLLGRSRDLLTAVILLRAQLGTEGFVALPDALALINGWLEGLWDSVHPQLDPDDQDPSARLSVLGMLVEPGAVLGDLRSARVVDDRRLGNLRVREVEVALGRLPPREGDEKRSPGELMAIFADIPEVGGKVRSAAQRAQAEITRLQRRLNDLVGSDRAVALAPLREVVRAVADAVGDAPPAEGGEAEAAAGADAGGGAESGTPASSLPAAGAAGGRRSGVFSVDSRQDALRALELVCAYLERVEPTNPAQLLVRRAAKLVDMTFLELVRELAPDGLREAAKVMGVDPNEYDN